MNFWNFKTVNRSDGNKEKEVVELRIEGDIVDDSDVWFYEWMDIPCASPNAFRQQLKDCDGKELHVIVDTFGGSVFAGSGIYSDLRKRKGKTIGIVESKAMSAGTIILMGCDEIRVSPSAILMVHDPATGMYGEIKDFENILKVLNTIKESIVNAYVDKTGLDKEVLADMMRNETWMSAHEAVEKGFADKILERETLAVDNRFYFGRQQIVNSASRSVRQIEKYMELKNKTEQHEIRLKELELYVDTF